MYRYGDGTPFPFEENFIDIVVAAVDAAASTFAAAAQLDSLRQKAQLARRDADDEGRRLTALEQALTGAAGTAGPSLGKDATLTQQTAQRALDAAKHAIVAARAQLDKRVAAAAAEPRVDRAMQAAFAAAARFFDHHELPRTSWDWKWVNDEGAEATARSGRFAVTYDLIEPPWSAPARIGALVPHLSVRLPRKRIFGKPAPAKVSLDKAGLVSVSRTGDAIVLGVRELASKPSGGWRIAFSHAGAAVGTCTPLDAAGQPIGAEIEIEGDNASSLTRLIDAVITAMDGVLARRRTRDVTINKVALRSMSDPAEPAKAMLDLLAPTIRTLCARSGAAGELVLKKDIADGRREELFVPRQQIAQKYMTLPPEYRRLFEAAGLGRELATDLDVDVIEDIATDRRPPRAPPPPPPRIPAAGPHMPTLMVAPAA